MKHPCKHFPIRVLSYNSGAEEKTANIDWRKRKGIQLIMLSKENSHLGGYLCFNCGLFYFANDSAFILIFFSHWDLSPLWGVNMPKGELHLSNMYPEKEGRSHPVKTHFYLHYRIWMLQWRNWKINHRMYIQLHKVLSTKMSSKFILKKDICFLPF